ncbi:hypothetical protein D3C72_1474140 [compost metagenome]
MLCRHISRTRSSGLGHIFNKAGFRKIAFRYKQMFFRYAKSSSSLLLICFCDLIDHYKRSSLRYILHNRLLLMLKA